MTDLNLSKQYLLVFNFKFFEIRLKIIFLVNENVAFLDLRLWILLLWGDRDICQNLWKTVCNVDHEYAIGQQRDVYIIVLIVFLENILKYVSSD